MEDARIPPVAGDETTAAPPTPPTEEDVDSKVMTLLPTREVVALLPSWGKPLNPVIDDAALGAPPVE